MKKFRSLFGHVLLVPGNHCYYQPEEWSIQKRLKSTLEIDSILERTCAKCNVVFLQKKNHVIADWTFVGCTLWSSVSERTWHCLNDWRGMSSSSEMKALHANHVGWLQDELSKLASSPSSPSSKVIVVTHYLPSFQAVHPVFRDSPINDGFASCLDPLLKLRSDIIWAWLCGHSHEAIDTTINGVWIKSNPLGYPSEKRATQFSKDPLPNSSFSIMPTKH